jgi:hypothetical protein
MLVISEWFIRLSQSAFAWIVCVVFAVFEWSLGYSALVKIIANIITLSPILYRIWVFYSQGDEKITADDGFNR